ncbi:MAG: hypothetical protein IH914_08200 [candidate division Zixibacteria bacterium]|nr:hypothetical protein [candidate division Zixibacteria bacterium]
MKRSLGSIILLVMLVSALFGTEVEFAPHRTAPLVNGKIGRNDWNYPAVFRMGFETGYKEGWFMMQQDERHLYICIEPRSIKYTGIDLFLDNGAGDVFVLHASTIHGERHLTDSGWGKTIWGPAELWSSNLTQEITIGDSMHVFPPEAFEFQISRELLPKKFLRYIMRFSGPEILVPPDADTLSSERWREWDIDDR